MWEIFDNDKLVYCPNCSSELVDEDITDENIVKKIEEKRNEKNIIYLV